MKTFLRTIFSLSMIYSLLLPFTANTKETSTSLGTTNNAQGHEAAKIDANKLLALLQASNEEKNTLQTKNTQLKQEIQDLENTNSLSNEHLKSLVIRLNNKIDKLESNSNHYVTSEQLELLATSFYERLRSTDDSVSNWGFISGWIASLITLILATFALFHVGRIRDIESSAKTTLKQSQRETRMAVNVAIRTSKQEAIDITHKWIEGEGAVAISNHINELNTQLESVEKSVLALKRNEQIVEETTNNIVDKEKALAISNSKTTGNKATSSTLLATDPKNIYQLARNAFLNNTSKDAMRLVNELINHYGLNTAIETGVVSIKLLILASQGEYRKIITYYDKNIYSLLPSLNIAPEPHGLLTSVICRSHLHLKNFSVVNQLAEDWYDHVITNNPPSSRIIQFFSYALTSRSNLGMELDTLLLQVNTVLKSMTLSSLERQHINNFKLQLESQISGLNINNIEQFVDSASNSQELLNRAVHATHICLITNEHNVVFEIYSKVKTSILKSQRNTNPSDYSTLLLNLATALYRNKRYHSAHRFAIYVESQVNSIKTYSLDYDGCMELAEILNECPKLIARKKIEPKA